MYGQLTLSSDTTLSTTVQGLQITSINNFTFNDTIFTVSIYFENKHF